jgi:hypothetical protein
MSKQNEGSAAIHNAVSELLINGNVKGALALANCLHAPGRSITASAATPPKREKKVVIKTTKAKVSLVKTTKATSSEVKDKANEAKSSSKVKSLKNKAVTQKRAKVNGVSISYHNYSMLQTVRELVNNGVNGAEGLSSTEIAEYRECGETGGECSTILDRLKTHGLIGWRLVEVKKSGEEEQSWPSRNFPSSTKRREFALLG